MEHFRHITSIAVRFADLDALGHLNNAKYATFIEQARIEYVQEVCGWRGEWHTLGMILAKIVIDFKAPIRYGDLVDVRTRCAHMGDKSFELEYQILRRKEVSHTASTAATASTVMVAYDYAAQQSIPLPDDWRSRITAYETGD
jgi:acyl-CoA thioester hydrolase